MNMNDWLTTKQAANRAEVTVQAIHGLCNRGALASMYVGRSRFVGRTSLNAFLEDPRRLKRTRVKSGQLALDVSYSPEELEALGQQTMDEEWSGVNPPLLSVEARRLYDESPRGQREARLAAEACRGEI